jgi:DnaJ-class molecular chaperone
MPDSESRSWKSPTMKRASPGKAASGVEDGKSNFQKASEGYKVLSDKEKRSAFDRSGKQAVQGGSGGGGPGGMNFPLHSYGPQRYE